MSTEVAPTATLARCHRNYVEGFWQYTKSTPGARRRPLGRSTLLRCGIGSPTANVWFLEDPGEDLVAAFGEARAFFGPRHPWRVIALGPRADEVGRVAVGHRMAPTAPEPGMILDPIPNVPPPSAGLEVRTVRSAAELHDFGTAWCAGFGIPRFIFRLVLPSVLPDDGQYGVQNRFLVGYADGRPVACSSVIVTEGVAGVVSVATTRPARGRGFGTAMTWRAVEEGQCLGADVAYLAATAMGLPVYTRMGFRKVADYPTWSTPVGSFRQLQLLFQMWRLARGRAAPGP